jgi:hypothetical protein
MNKVKGFLKNVLDQKGSEIIAIALILIFVILIAAKPIKNLGKTTETGVTNLNTELSTTLSE